MPFAIWEDSDAQRQRIPKREVGHAVRHPQRQSGSSARIRRVRRRTSSPQLAMAVADETKAPRNLRRQRWESSISSARQIAPTVTADARPNTSERISPSRTKHRTPTATSPQQNRRRSARSITDGVFTQFGDVTAWARHGKLKQPGQRGVGLGQSAAHHADRQQTPDAPINRK